MKIVNEIVAVNLNNEYVYLYMTNEQDKINKKITNPKIPSSSDIVFQRTFQLYNSDVIILDL